MIRLHASYGLKVPAAQEYSSQSYHASVEIEVPDTALKDSIPATLSSLWHELRGAVEQQLAGKLNNPPASSVPRNGNGSYDHGTAAHRSPALPATTPQGNGAAALRSPAPQSQSNGEPATKKQVNYLISCAKRFRNLNMDQTCEWLAKAHNTTLETITKPLAGQIIDELTGKSAGAR